MKTKILDNPKMLSEVFKERLDEFYLDSIYQIEQSFGKGVLLTCLIDFLAKIQYPNNNNVGNRIKEFCKEFLNFSPDNANFFYEYVRNGLVHEGRLKKGTFFDEDSSRKIDLLDNGIIKLNPDLIVQDIQNWLEKCFLEIKNKGSKYERVRNYIENNIINEDVEAINDRQEN